MSNYLAIATVTTTLQRILQRSIQLDVEGASVTTIKPENIGGGTPETGVNIYLYHIKRNSTRGNADMPGRQRRGEIVKRNQIGIDLFYVITFYGNDNELEPQRLLGSTLKILEDRSLLNSQIIRETIADPAFPYLADSDLADQIDMIRAEFLSISTDELSKIWSVFFQTSYALSVVYKVTVVLIEGEEPLQRALPVKARNITLLPYFRDKQPIIQQVTAQTGKYQPILANSTLLIRGQMLSVPEAKVRIGKQLLTPATIKATEICLPLALIPHDALKAGAQTLQVGRYVLDLNGEMPIVESNVFPFILCPTIIEIEIVDLEELEEESYSGEVVVTLDVLVGSEQRAIILLNHKDAGKNKNYLFNAQARDEDSETISFMVNNIRSGDYLVRVQIDGAESVLQIDTNRDSSTFEQYIAPTLQI